MMFHDGARICFVGDSITAQNIYVARIAAYCKENCPDKNISIFNCGVSGGSAESQLVFFDDDTACHNPTHIFIMVGVNDSWRDRLGGERCKERYDILKERYEIFKVNFDRLCQKALQTGAKVTLITPPPYAEYEAVETPAFRGGYALIQGYAEYVKNYAKEKKLALIDIHDYLTVRMQTEVIYNPDRVHPNDKGQYYIAKFILESEGLDIGEYKDIPNCLKDWGELNRILRAIYMMELIVIGVKNYTLSVDEKKRIMQKCYDSVKEGKNGFYEQACIYLEYKDRQAEIADKITKLASNNVR